MNDFTHINHKGDAHMVDISAKEESFREATATAFVVLNKTVLDKILKGEIAKGDLLATARIAGIQAAKKCSDLIPLCHPLPLSKVSIDIEPVNGGAEVGLEVLVTCKTVGKTGVEMEAMTAAAVTALTIYDMCKALDKGFAIKYVRLLAKSGGKSGDWQIND